MDADVPLQLVALEGSLELGNRVVVFVGQLPPVRAQLRDVLCNRLLELIIQGLKLLVNFGEVLQIQLHTAVKLVSGLSITSSTLVVLLVLRIVHGHTLSMLGRTRLLIVILVQLLISLFF